MLPNNLIWSSAVFFSKILVLLKVESAVVGTQFFLKWNFKKSVVEVYLKLCCFSICFFCPLPPHTGSYSNVVVVVSLTILSAKLQPTQKETILKGQLTLGWCSQCCAGSSVMPFCVREDELESRMFCSASHFHLQLFQMRAWGGAEGVACTLCVLCAFSSS